MLTEQEKSIDEVLMGYRQNPVDFGVDILGLKREYIWSKMIEVVESVRDHQFTAVPAGHSVSKTFSAGRLVIPWFKFCFQPSTVITTAPSDNQIRNQLWREIHAAVNSARVPLGGSLTALQWDMKLDDKTLALMPPECRENYFKNFAIGFSTKPDDMGETVTKMQGWHNEWVLIVLDEADGISQQIWKTVLDSLVTNERPLGVRVLAIGNPTSSTGYFADACKPGSGWNVVRIPVTSTPNYIEGREVIPGLAGRSYAERIKQMYGEDSVTYKVRVLGEAPEYTEGTYLGSWMAKAEKEGRIGSVDYDENFPVFTVADYGTTHSAVWFVQFMEGWVHWIDFYYDGQGQGFPEYSRVFQEKRYTYGGHYTFHDIWESNSNSFSGEKTADMARRLGVPLIPIEKCSLLDRIFAAKGVIPKSKFSLKCGEGIDALRTWRPKKNTALSTEDKAVYNEGLAVRDWTCHVGDAASGVGILFLHMTVKGERLGNREMQIIERAVEEDDYVLTRGL